MKVLVIGIDSDIGAQIAAQHAALGDEIITTSRNRKGTHFLELAHPLTWPTFSKDSIDLMYYCIGVGDGRVSRIEVMQVNAFLSCDCLVRMRPAVKSGGQVVVLSSGWSSISELKSGKAPVYRMSKAALNMGVAIIANRETGVKWTLMHPGLVKTKMTSNMQVPHTGNLLDPVDSAAGVIRSAKTVVKQFAFVDYEGNEVMF